MEGGGREERVDERLVRRIREAGFGSEAIVYLENRNFFPGIGWDIYTTQALGCANREDHNYSKNIGHYNFLRHSIIKKLEDFFVQQDKYRTAHIPRPLGSTDRGYIYEFVLGSEGFPWGLIGRDGEKIPTELEEWNIFSGAFATAGVDLHENADPDDQDVSKNIIFSHRHELDKLDYENPSLSSLWAKIDFGSRSTTISPEKLEKFLNENKEKLIITLSSQRYEFLKLALDYLKEGPQNMDRRDIGKLEILAGDFRISTLSHLNRRGFSSDFSKKCGIYLSTQRID